MVFKALFAAILVLFSCLLILATCSSVHNYSPVISNGSFLTGIDIADQSFNVVTSSASDYGFSNPDHINEESEKRVGVNYGKPVLNSEKPEEPHVVKLPVKRRTSGKLDGRRSVIESTLRDLNRIHTFRRRILENKNQNAPSRLSNHRELLEEHPTEVDVFPGHLVRNLKSGVSLGSGEYFIDVYLGTPPKHFLLILDTGSDLNWIQCAPCYDYFEQDGPHYDPKFSTSFKNISGKDPKCDLVSAPDPPQPCKGVNQSCLYFYWYGDSSNTTGDFALETFRVNQTSSDAKSEFTDTCDCEIMEFDEGKEVILWSVSLAEDGRVGETDVR